MIRQATPIYTLHAKKTVVIQDTLYSSILQVITSSSIQVYTCNITQPLRFIDKEWWSVCSNIQLCIGVLVSSMNDSEHGALGSGHQHVLERTYSFRNEVFEHCTRFFVLANLAG